MASKMPEKLTEKMEKTMSVHMEEGDMMGREKGINLLEDFNLRKAIVYAEILRRPYD